MSNKAATTVSRLHCRIRHFIFVVPFLIILHGCNSDLVSDSGSGSNHDVRTVLLKIHIQDQYTQDSLSGVEVKVIDYYGVSKNAITDKNGMAKLTFSAKDAEWIQAYLHKKGYLDTETSIYINNDQTEYHLSIEPIAYLRCHVINKEPISTNERIDIFTPKKYNYGGPTNTIFIAQVMANTTHIPYDVYWNNVLDSTIYVPVKFTTGDTTDLAITF